MTYLADMLGGKSENDLEKAVDRVFLNMSIQKGIGWFFDPDRKKRKLEEQLLEQSLATQQSILPESVQKVMSVLSYLPQDPRKLAKIFS